MKKDLPGRIWSSKRLNNLGSKPEGLLYVLGQASLVRVS